MYIAQHALLVIAAICFACEVVSVPLSVKWIPLGLLCWVLSILSLVIR